MLLLQKHQQQLLQQQQQQQADESADVHQKASPKDNQLTQLEHIKHKRKDEESEFFLSSIVCNVFGLHTGYTFAG